MNVIDICKITGSNTLAGKSAGQRDLPRMMAAIQETPDESSIILDWSGVEIATSSYFGTTVVPLLRMSMTGGLDRYFILTGLNSTCVDELKLVLESQELVALYGRRTRVGGIENLVVLGNLAPAHAETLAALRDTNGVSASDLHKRAARDHGRGIGKTGWINRLSNLHRLRLVRKHKTGRETVFEAISLEARDGR
jgi:hypothetical protein